MKVIFFEGPDGTGKSTQLKRLTQGGLASLFNVQRFPSGSSYGQAARQSGEPVCAAFSHAADFRLMLRFWRDEGRRPVLVCDRGPLSTMAYQGYGNKVGYDNLKPVIDLAMQGVDVAATIIFYAPFKTCVHRIQIRDGEEMTQNELDKFTRAWQAYEHFRLGNRSDDEFARREFMDGWEAWIGKLHFIDATQPEDVIQAQVEAIVRSIIAIDKNMPRNKCRNSGA